MEPWHTSKTVIYCHYIFTFLWQKVILHNISWNNFSGVWISTLTSKNNNKVTNVLTCNLVLNLWIVNLVNSDQNLTAWHLNPCFLKVQDFPFLKKDILTISQCLICSSPVSAWTVLNSVIPCSICAKHKSPWQPKCIPCAMLQTLWKTKFIWTVICF